MPMYQNSVVTDAKIELGNYAISVHPTAGSTAAAAGWVNLGAGMLKTFNYITEPFTSQAGNAPDPVNGVARETVKMDMDLLEYDGSSFSTLSGGLIAGTSGSITVGGQVVVQAARGLKLVNTRKLASGSTQTTTYVVNYTFMDGGFNLALKSDNDTDPVAVYSFSMLAKQYATAQTLFTKTVA